MRPYLVLFLLLIVSALPAQEFSNSLKIMGLYGNTPYLGELAPGAAFHFDFLLRKKISLTVGAGLLGNTVGTNGNISGISGGQDWEVNYSYKQKEYFSYFEAGVLWNPFSSKTKNLFKIGGGATLTHTVFEYVSELEVTTDGLQITEFGQQSKLVPMLNFIVEDELNLTKRISVFGRGNFRTSVVTQAYIDQIVRSPNSGTTINGSGIIFNTTIALGLGYKF